ncbi:MAG: TonB-dependent receptor [Cyclobacteriaceae bacterium]|nr:TonB-dependent receptor [Cyclobacteriaceae bacterium]
MNKKNTGLLSFCRQLATGITATFMVIAFNQAGAQDTLITQNLQEIVVTASRTEQNLSDVGRSMAVVSAKDIQNSPYSNVSELLSGLEGIYIVGTGQNPGSLQHIYLRGANSEHTLILIDGIRITDPSSVDNAINLAELSTANIERIEVLRGSHSTLYGSSAIGGIINIITKKGAKTGLSGNAGVKAGTFGKSTLELEEQVYINYSTESGFYISGEVLNAKINGIDATLDTVTTTGVFKNRDMDGFSKTDLIGKAGFNNKQWDVFGSYKMTSQSLDIDDGAYNDDENHVVDFNRNLFSWQAAYQINDNINIKYLGGYTAMKRAILDDSSIVDQAGNYDRAWFEATYQGTVDNNEIQANYKTAYTSVILGGGSYGETMTSKSYYTNKAWFYTSETDLDTFDIHTRTNSIFTHIDINGGALSAGLDKVQLALGARFNNHSTFGNYLTWEVNPSVKAWKGALAYASFATGFNAPALYRLYDPNANWASGITRGNIDLKSESSQTIELGIKQQAGKTTSFSMAVFQTQVENLIEYVYLWDKAIGLDTLGNDWMRNDYRGDTYLNLGNQTNQGIEGSIQTQPIENLTLGANISLVKGKLHYLPENSDHTQDYHVQLFNTGEFLNKEIVIEGLTRRSNTANLFVSYQPTEQLHLQADLRHAGQRSDIFYDVTLGPWGALGRSEVGNYTLTGLTVRYELIKNLNTTLRIDNIFNVSYQEIHGYSTRGRGVYLKVKYKL